MRYPARFKPAPVTNARRVKLQAEKDASLSEAETKLIAQFRRLSAHQRHLIAELIEQLAIEQEIWPEQN